jgi:hypothetical protein
MKIIIVTLLFFACFLNVYAQDKWHKIYGYCLFQDRNGDIFYHSNKSIFKYDSVTPKKYEINMVVKSFYKDIAGNFFCNSLFDITKKFDGTTLTKFPIAASKFFEDSKGNIFVVSLGSNQTLYKYVDNKLNIIHKINELPFSNNNIVNCFFEDTDGSIYIGVGGSNNTRATSRGAVFKFDGNDLKLLFKTNYSVNIIFSDSKGNKWVSTGLNSGVGELYNYNGKDLISFDFEKYNYNEKIQNISTIVEDKTGNIWFGTTKGGIIGNGMIFKFDGENLTYFNKEKLGIAFLNVYSCIVDDNNNVWFGLAYGLLKISDNKIEFYDRTNSLLKTSVSIFGPDIVSKLLKDKHGNIWLSETYYISKYGETDIILIEK